MKVVIDNGGVMVTLRDGSEFRLSELRSGLSVVVTPGGPTGGDLQVLPLAANSVVLRVLQDDPSSTLKRIEPLKLVDERKPTILREGDGLQVKS